jgi:dipeptidyl aminopeptidase/acylaminoacyl peptidase
MHPIVTYRGSGLRLAGRLVIALAAACSVLAPASVRAADSLQVYGNLPDLDAVSISPVGDRIAYIKSEPGTREIVVSRVADRKVLTVMPIGEVKVRAVRWADDGHLMIEISDSINPDGSPGRSGERLRLLVLDVVTHDVSRVPDPHKVRGAMDLIAGEPVIRRINGHTVIFVITASWANFRPLRSMVRCDLDTGEQREYANGSFSNVDWLVGISGGIAAEEDYDARGTRWVVKIPKDGEYKTVVEGVEAIDIPRILGFGPQPDTLLLAMVEGGEIFWRPLALKDGSIGPPITEARNLWAPIEDPITHRMVGGVYIDDTVRYVFFDRERQRIWDSITHAFSGAQVSFESATWDFRKIVVRVESKELGYLYELVDLDLHKALRIGDVYNGVTAPFDVRRITYAAADGLEIPAYLTMPRTGSETGLPLVVLVHGGPESRDTADFDWWSQALAAQGYAVLRANFRGSSLGRKFVALGYGEFGRKMQTDLSDGVRYLVKTGIVDPARVCIVGASYGGYAALAGVTLDAPGVYRCAVSIAGLADLRAMLHWIDMRSSTVESPQQRFWYRFMGVNDPADSRLDQISPILHVDAVQAPILLIHGHDDTVVPTEQSERMFAALKEAKKDVRYVELANEDHWLSRSATRQQMLRESVEFLRLHNPPGAAPASAQDATAGVVQGAAVAPR